MKLKFKKWVKVVLFFILIIVLFVIVKDLFTKKTIVITQGKDYTCYGSIMKVCSGKNYDIE